VAYNLTSKHELYVGDNNIMLKDRVLYLGCFGFATGVLLRSFVRVDLGGIVFIGLVYIFLIFLSPIIVKKNHDVSISIFALAFLLGILRFHIADVPPPAAFEAQAGKNVSISALIVDEPAKNGDKVKLIVETGDETGAKIDIKGPKTGIVVFSKTDLGFHYGDEIEISGKLEKPANFMTDQDMEFDYVNYLRKDGIFYAMHDPKIEILSSGHGNPVKRALFSVRESFDAAIGKAVPAPESIVLGGIILGERYAFSQSLRQSFMDTGTIHIVTIGGYHVTLVARWIMDIFSFLPKYAGIGAGVISIFLYVIVTGGAETSIRAGIMATLALVAGATGRMYMAGRALIIAATAMIFINPFVLAYDVSFELSFIATIAIIFLSPMIEPYFQWIPWKWLRDIVAITSSMYFFALPFVLYRMGNLSLVALPANILIVPLMPLSMISGFMTGFAGLVSPAFAVLPGKVAYALLHYQITAIGTLAHLPFAAVAIQNFSLPFVVLVYAVFFWIFWRAYGHAGDKEVRMENGSDKAGQKIRRGILLIPLAITLGSAGFLYYSHFMSNQAAEARLQDLLHAAAAAEPAGTFTPDDRKTSADCKIDGPYPDHSCTPGAVFADATAADTCVAGYTATVRNVSAKTKKEVFEEYGMTYPQPTGAYEVDHFIPLALGGSNDIANLFPEAAAPIPGFHEKDIVEVFLQGEVCSGRTTLGAAQRQISTDWLAVYGNIPFEKIQQIKKKYGGSAVQ